MSTPQDSLDVDAGQGSSSFWEIGNYKYTVRRIDDGNRLCNDLVSLVAERSEIEKTYAKSLRSWSKKWQDLVSKGPEYGTVQSAWLGALSEADRLCELHIKIRNQLVDEVQAKIKQWQKDNYHKSMMAFKEVKEAEDGFRKAQKPWAKKLDKVVKAMKDYHQACKSEKTAINQEKNALSDSALSDDQKKKLGEKVEKCQKDVTLCKEKYELSLSEITNYNAEYIENMTEVFQKCQSWEKKRQEFFKEIMQEICGSLNVASNPEYAVVYSDLRQTILAIDEQADLRWWSQNHGVDMPMNWPAFEDYSPDFHSIARKSRREKPLDSGEGIMITAIKRQPDSSAVIAEQNGGVNTVIAPAATHSAPTVVTTVISNKESAAVYSRPKEDSSKTTSGHQERSLNPFEIDEDLDVNLTSGARTSATASTDNLTSAFGLPHGGGGDDLVDDGHPGVPVRALYDYVGAEEDELSFSAGDVFEKLEDEDEQGWCTGRKDGRVGLYPANYVEETAN